MAMPPDDGPPSPLFRTAQGVSAAAPEAVAFGRVTVRTATAEPHQAVQAARPSCTPEALPDSLVRQILGHVPVSWHASCALVCRQWHRALPPIRVQAALWLQARSCQLQQARRQLSAGYVDRIRPWLSRQGSELVPVLDCQKAEVQRLQDILCHKAGAPVRLQLEAAQGWFSGLLHYSLYKQQLAAPPVLQPVGQLGGEVTLLHFSPCSRWLATARQKVAGDAEPAFLYLHGWSANGWQPEPLGVRPPAAQWPVETFAFHDSVPGRLLSAHSAGQLVCWSRQPDTAVWEPALLLKANDDHKAQDLFINNEGVLFVLFRRGGSHQHRVLTLQEGQDGQGWSRIISQGYGLVFADSCHPASAQVALATTACDGRGLVVHIWGPDPDSSPPGSWGFVESRLPQSLRALQLHYSPDGRHLLGLLSVQGLQGRSGGQRACLWQIDSQRQLHLRLDVACFFSTEADDMAAQRLFAHNGRQLVLPLSLHLMQFYVESSHGRWQPGDTLSLAPASADAGDDNLRYLLWSADGQRLIRVTWNHIDIWRRNPPEPWQWLVRHRADARDRAAPQAFLLPPCYSRCATALWQEGHVWLYAPQTSGHMTRQACFLAGAPLSDLLCSPDGLSLVLCSGPAAPVHLLDLAGRTPGGVSPARLPAAVPTAGSAVLSPAQTLPGELLYKIFCYLPLSGHSLYARVCRHWYASLPEIRIRMARWVRDCAAPLLVGSLHVTAGYCSRFRPWQALQPAARRAALECQYQQVLEHQARRSPDVPAPLAASAPTQPRSWPPGDTLAGFMQYSLYQQIAANRQLRLEPVALDPAFAASVRLFDFSLCGRWLATGCAQPGSEQHVLRVHGWRHNGWQEETLVPAPQQPVTRFAFSQSDPDTLFSVHGSLVLVWQQAAASRCWRCVSRSLLDSTATLVEMAPMACGDLVVARRQRPGVFMDQLLFVCHSRQDNSWGQRVCHFYGPQVRGIFLMPRLCQLVLALGTQISQGRYRNEVCIWNKPLPGGGPAQWTYRISTLGFDPSCIKELSLPRNGRQLLVLLANGALSLFALDSHGRVHSPLMLSACFTRDTMVTARRICFRRDGQQLALAHSLHNIRFWNRLEDGSWRRKSCS